ncbi:MAG: hypothetical protein R3F14_21500 [Polyangiaceae bacterium]
MEVSDDDTHLLVLTRHEVKGGGGGAPGQNGTGGMGGAGGSGGSSYSWTETDSYTDSNGQTQTRTTHHSNPGGSSGPSGRSGRPGVADLTFGKDGRNGSFEIHVTSPEGTRTYTSRYDLRLTGFIHTSENEDDVYEPEERVLVRQIQVQNTGGMPTPSRREIRLSLRDKGWIAADPGHLVLPPSLMPGATHVFKDDQLSFTLGAFHPSRPSDPLAEEQIIHHRAALPDANREFEDYESPLSAELGRFTVRFPLEVTPITSLHSLAPGSAARVQFRITNVSARAFGEESELRRAVSFRLYLHESELSSEELVFFDPEGKRVDLDVGFRRTLPLLEPGQSVDVEGTIAIPESAPHYRAGRAWLSLELGAIEAPSRVRPIQYRDLEIRVARPFVSREPTDLLLLVNNRTTAEEVKAWEQLGGWLGLSVGVYDLSLQGGIDLDAGVEGSRPLGEIYEGRTMVVLNNLMDTAKGRRTPARYLAKEQLLRHAAKGGRVMIAGDEVDLSALLVPTGGGFDDGKAMSEVAFREMLKGEGEKTLEVGGPPIVLDVFKWSVLFWGDPGESAMEKRALAIEAALREAYPDRRYVVVTDLEPTALDNYHVCKRWNMGRIAVHRTLDAARGALLSIAAPEHALHSAEAITGRAATMSLLLALPFEEKLRRFELLAGAANARAGGGESEETGAAAAIEDDDMADGALSRDVLLRMLVDAMLVDLANEQTAILHRGDCGRAGSGDFRASLPMLGHLSAALSDRGAGESLTAPRSVHLLRLLGRLRFFAAVQPRWWEYLPPFLLTRRAPVLRRVTLGMIEDLAMRALVGPEPKSKEARARWKAVKAELAAVGEAMSRRYDEARDHDVLMGRKSVFARDALLRPIDREGTTTCAELRLRAADRVLPREEHEKVMAEDRKRSSKRKAMMATSDEARSALQRPESCAELLAASGARVVGGRGEMGAVRFAGRRGMRWNTR